MLYATDSRDIDELQRVEAVAARRFLAVPELAFLASAGVTDRQTHAAAIENKLAWKVTGNDGRIHGFCYCERHEDTLYLAEISTHPDFQRQGVGAMLLAEVKRMGQLLGVSQITLTTYRDVSWNAPWYGRHGFVVIDDAALTPMLARCLAHQRDEGLMVLPRCAMRYLLGEGKPPIGKPFL
ncbi:GNAT family N-acetyltransferase [Cedecea sp. NFIX57]|uniref:GNAT family N-acetyltransferase n=1 Tax=Cedecea sp. NFIX57 TaxID=1566286 RepID=UPI000A0CE521|nr:GNAT family N-acetyltransferase [Cedecea sp. NFIX57]SMG28905.1 Ribosomal protein S18 acetylase RimI [Cedecea sp. NFIX57]